MRRAQTTTIDLVLAVGIMVFVTVVATTLFTANTQPPPLAQDAQALAGVLFAPYPLDWDSDSVISPGFVVNHRLNQSLLEEFQTLTNVHELVGINSFYFVNTSAGSAGTPPLDAKNIYSITRYAAHQGNITAVEVVVWLD